MSLPARQQQTLDQIEQVLQATDPRLKSMFAAFARLAPRDAAPATEVITHRSARRTVLICVMVLSLLGVLMLSILATKDVCPGLSSDQAVVSASVRYAACSKSTDAWSRGAR
ncbi:MAG TPA: DUF3040 domain-containing protein [Streptosporangiaceae bacterium]